MDSYKEKYGYRCMHPGCTTDYEIETHHIIPLSKGGLDDRSNYITLCKKCHHRTKLHSQFLVHDITLATWKYYFESSFGEEEDQIKPEVIFPEKKLELLDHLLIQLDLISDTIRNDDILRLEQKVRMADFALYVEGQILKLIQ